jgi:hypothetical protein
MVARIRDGKRLCICLMLAIELLLNSCATQKQPAHLVNDPDATQDSTTPWNKQEQWEAGAAMGPAIGGAGGPTGSDRR